MSRYLEPIERTLDGVLPRADERPAALHEAMRYAVGTGGKRIRPVICLAAAEAVGGCLDDALYPACAIELLHNYTLIHDDLPAMDNDVLRRGRPTVWKKFGEANAILAGDALLALAYRVAAKAPRNVAAIVDVLGEKGVGVVRGQVEDMRRETEDMRGRETEDMRREGLSSPVLRLTSSAPEQPFVYLHKTADLFVAAAVMGALAAGGTARDIKALGDFACNLGLAFQYEDDLLDGDGLYPRAETEARVRETTAAAIAALKDLPGDTTFLKSLAERLTQRKN